MTEAKGMYTRVKKDILNARQTARRSITEFQSQRYLDKYREMRAAILAYYYEVRPHVEKMEEQGALTGLQRQLSGRPKPVDSMEELLQSDLEFYQTLFNDLDRVIHDLNIIDLSSEATGQPHGYEITDGLDHSLKTRGAGLRKLKANLDSLRKLLRQDTDTMGIIWGGNRTGKTTLNLIICDYLQHGKNTYDLGTDHVVFDKDDFSEAMNELPRYSAVVIDELSQLFHKKQTMSGDQVKRNQMLKAYAKRNMAIIGCDNQFYNIDTELISDKIDFAIHVPERGRFEFYTPRQVNRFEQDDEGRVKRPRPEFKGVFPDLSEHEQGRELWERYRDVENQKLDVEQDSDLSTEEEKKRMIQNAAEEIIEDPAKYVKEIPGQGAIVNKSLIEAEYGLKTTEAGALKEKVAAEIEPEKYV